MAEETPMPTPLPTRPKTPEEKEEADQPEAASCKEPTPIFRLRINDLSHIGSSQLLNLVDASNVLPNALKQIQKYLYPSESATSSKKVKFHLPPTRSVTMILRAMDGVAYTTGLEIDSSHKEIHINLNYIRDCTSDARRRRDEIIGVVTHELVHCYQWDALGTAPGGLIEGIADFIRLKASLGPPHWFGEGGKREKGDKWDNGYQKTAFFLDWLEEAYGVGTVARINEALRKDKYDEEEFWQKLFGKDVTIKSLWKDYQVAPESTAGAEEGSPSVPVPTCPVAATEKPVQKDEGNDNKNNTSSNNNDDADASSTALKPRISSDSYDVVVVENE